MANISPALVNIYGVTANNKIYDQTTNASINTSSAVVDVYLGDSVSANGRTTLVMNSSLLSGSTTGAFANAGAGIQNVTVNAVLTDTTNYTVSSVANASAVISPASVVITGLIANNKVYDTSTNASINTSGASVVVNLGNSLTANGGVLAGTTNNSLLSPQTNGFFDTAGASSSSQNVNIHGVLSDSSNYTISSINGVSAVSGTAIHASSAMINPALVSINGITIADKRNDGSLAATVSNNGVGVVLMGNSSVANNTTISQPFSGYQVVNASFADSSVGSNKPVTFIVNLLDSANYSFANGSQTLSYGNILNARNANLQNGLWVIVGPDGKSYGVNSSSGSFVPLASATDELTPMSPMYQPVGNVSQRDINNSLGREAHSLPVEMQNILVDQQQKTSYIRVINSGINDGFSVQAEK